MPSPSAENGGATRNFPTDPNDFDSDLRISFSKLDNKFILETEDGQEFEWDSAIKRWVHQVWLLRPSCVPRFSMRRLREELESHVFETERSTLTLEWQQVDEELLRQQQEAYKVAGVEDDEPLHPRDRKKRKQQTSGDDVRIASVAPCVYSSEC